MSTSEIMYTSEKSFVVLNTDEDCQIAGDATAGDWLLPDLPPALMGPLMETDGAQLPG
ncbi:hypothetical protein J6590_020481, partial [Homalodisca vitripennis]